MAACYFLGVKKITSKKSGKDFYPANFLCLNSWGDWTTVTKFCESESVFEEILDNVDVGAPVVCTLGMNGELLKCIQHDSVPALELDDSGSM